MHQKQGYGLGLGFRPNKDVCIKSSAHQKQGVPFKDRILILCRYNALRQVSFHVALEVETCDLNGMSFLHTSLVIVTLRRGKRSRRTFV